MSLQTPPTPIQAPSQKDTLPLVVISSLSSFFLYLLLDMLRSSWDLCSLTRIEPRPLEVKAQNLNPWTTRKFPGMHSSPLNGNSVSTFFIFFDFDIFWRVQVGCLLVFLYQVCVAFPPAILNLCFWREHCRSGVSLGCLIRRRIALICPHSVILASTPWLKWGPSQVSTVNLPFAPLCFIRIFWRDSIETV